MKKSFLVLAIASLMFAISCQNESKEPDYAIISGKVINRQSDSLKVHHLGKVISSVKLQEDGSFSDTFPVQKDFYYISYGKSKLNFLYLQAGYNLSLKIDGNSEDSLKITGKGSEENIYFIKVADLDEKIGIFKQPSYYCKFLNEADFLKLNDSIYDLSKKLLEEYKNKLDKEFFFIQDKNLEYDKLCRIQRYEYFNTYYYEHDTPFKVSENYPNPYENIDFSNPKLAKVSSYIKLLERYINSFEDSDTTNEYLTIKKLVRADTLIKNEEIKKSFIINHAIEFLESTEHLDSLYGMLKTMITKEEALKNIEKTYQDLKKIAKGNPAPAFNLKDINGNMVSLESLKGNVVYIDVWATWCGPCRGEIPHLKKLEKEMRGQDIKFVSMCVWDKENKWKEFVAKHEMEGIQLYASRDELSFVEAFHIKGIPHFIIVDKQGLIYDNNAKRPSNKALKAELEALLSK